MVAAMTALGRTARSIALCLTAGTTAVLVAAGVLLIA
jgi:hypothetical protein